MSKHTKNVLEILDNNKIKSTNEILSELQKKSKTVVNWHVLYRILMELLQENKAERLNAKSGFYWRKK
jgi:hypothetical protein